MKIYRISDFPKEKEYESNHNSYKKHDEPRNDQEWGSGHYGLDMDTNIVKDVDGTIFPDSTPLTLSKYIEEMFHNATPIGSGCYGIAYDLQDGTILKLTTDPTEIHAAIQLQKTPFPYFCKIYGVYIIQKRGGRYNNIYGLKIEKLLPLTPDEKQIVCDETTELRGLDAKSILHHLQSTEETEKIIEQKVIEDISREVIHLMINISNQGFKTSEVHRNNIGRDSQGNLKLFDLGDLLK